MRSLFLVLVMGFGLCAQRAQAQTVAQTMTFSIVVQYQTNVYVTNASNVTEYKYLLTGILSTANLVKAMAADLFPTNWTLWESAHIVYEQNLTNGHQGIFLREGLRQTNVSSFFTNSVSAYAYSNYFSEGAGSALMGTNYTSFGVNPTSLPLFGGYQTFHTDTNEDVLDNTTSANLAYMTFSSSNTAFNLYGFSQGPLESVILDGYGHLGNVYKAQFSAAGTFRLNLTTNFLQLTGTNFLVGDINHTVTNAVPPNRFNGVAHGTVYMSGAYVLNPSPTNAP